MKGGEKIMKKIIFLFFLVLFVFILPATVLGGNKPGACYVPSTHITIQSAVNDTECSEIMVAPGNWAGALEIKNNNVVQNKVSLVSNNSNLVDVVAFEMTDTRDDEDDPVIFDNSV